jgi:hypothetical protein
MSENGAKLPFPPPRKVSHTRTVLSETIAGAQHAIPEAELLRDEGWSEAGSRNRVSEIRRGDGQSESGHEEASSPVSGNRFSAEKAQNSATFPPVKTET